MAIPTLDSQLTQRDRAIIWHPFTQYETDPLPIAIVKAQGAYLYSDMGTRYIDAVSSWWTNLHGHSHPYIAEKIYEQAQNLQHVMFADYTHEPAILLAERLKAILPPGLNRFFYSDNGSTAVEAALKIIFQFWHNKGAAPEKDVLICFKGGYHGDTFGAMSAAGKTSFNRPFWPFMFDVEWIDPPFAGKEEESYAQLNALIEHKSVAGFIFEPIIQGFNGMKSHSAKGLDVLMEICEKNNILTIADEVMTGFGRTGPLFACEYLKHTPDIICLAKGLTGGALPLALTVCKDFIFEGFQSQDRAAAFLHGHTYTANPLGCAAALASLDLLLTNDCSAQRARIEASHLQFKEQYQHLWERCEVQGTILSLEYKTREGDSGYFSSLKQRIVPHFFAKHVVLRPFGNYVHVLPPYCVSEEDLYHIYQTLLESLSC
ncbi:MAG: adenosylmethionine--8-amino-7-oxononanoate transaminase [Parachlamydiales bacterium]|jgi:adenosylmethionine-8-amino-7-oxononanoate aminotransferase